MKTSLKTVIAALALSAALAACAQTNGPATASFSQQATAVGGAR